MRSSSFPRQVVVSIIIRLELGILFPINSLDTNEIVIISQASGCFNYYQVRIKYFVAYEQPGH
jgi:hypothetical protein